MRLTVRSGPVCPLAYRDKYIVGMTGVEPASHGLKARCITVLLHTHTAPDGTRTHILALGGPHPLPLNDQSLVFRAGFEPAFDG